MITAAYESEGRTFESFRTRHFTCRTSSSWRRFNVGSRRAADAEARADAIRSELFELEAIRKSVKLSPAEVAKAMGVKRPSLARIERQGDLLLSTLRRYVEAVGGSLDLVVTLPGSRPMILKTLGSIIDGEPVNGAE